jgi:hypothetical protein
MTESPLPQVTQPCEQGCDIRRKSVTVVGVSSEPEVYQGLSEAPKGVVDGVGDRLLDRLAITSSDAGVLVKRQAQEAIANAQQDDLVPIDRF